MRNNHIHIKILLRCCLLLLSAAALQLISGPLDSSFLQFPLGAILAALYVYTLVELRLHYGNFHFFSDTAAKISSLVLMLAVLIFFGIFGQLPISRNWFFVIPLLYFCSVLISVSTDEVRALFKGTVQRTALPRLGSHLGLSVILIAGIFGSGDFTQINLKVEKESTTTHGYDKEGNRHTLPFSISLKNFSMQEHVSESEGKRVTVPKHFQSDVKIGYPDERTEEKTITVNHTAKVKGWRLYQKGYATRRGYESSYSILTAVKDPWYFLIRIGLWTILLSGLGMVFKGGKKK